MVRLTARDGEDVEGLRTWGRHPALFAYDPRPLWRALGEPCDVIDIHEEPFAVATAEVLLIRALRRNPAPYVLYSAQNIDKRYPVPFRWLERWALRHASGVQVCNSEAGRIVERKGFPGRATLIPLGVDTRVFSPDTSRTPISGRLRVGYVGRLAEHKGVATLLDAAAAEPRITLALAGAGPDEATFRARAAKPDLEGRVEFLGGLPQEQLPEFYRSCDAIAVPSRTTPGWVEQFGRVAVEAMASGVPVVAANSGSLPDVCRGAGLLVPEDDPRALADALLRIADEPGLAERLRDLGRTRALECSWERVGASFDRLYRVASHQPADTAQAARRQR